MDIDGTLLDKNGIISTADRKALAEACTSGIRVSLSTGRATQACLNIINQLSLNGYHIFYDGALVSNPETGEEIYFKPISENLVKEAIDFAHRHKINLELFSTTHYFIERETRASDIRRQFFGLQPIIVDFTKLWQNERIVKGNLVVYSPEEKAKADTFYLQFKNSLHFSWTNTPAYPDVDFINVLAPDVSKGEALEVLASYLKIPLSEVIAVGDGANDISLLTKAGLGIAMGNASEELKAVADYVTLDIDHSGVAAVIKKFLLQA
ncbi:MAG: Cof-type HAD-IIB family hydrolase [Dehalococcoidales bacterium]|nr:Cof-type HAD-IIB family hydrolase [Dehalococcoidales bacterium]